MSRPRILRLLRIAFSVVCGIVCLLLIVLWVRSFWWLDVFKVGVLKATAVQGASKDGRLVLVMFPSRVSFLRCSWTSISGAKIDAALATNAGYIEQTQGLITTLKRQIAIWDGKMDTAGMESEIMRLNGLIDNAKAMPEERIIAQMLGNPMQAGEELVSNAIVASSSIVNRWGFGGKRLANGWAAVCPHWFLVMFSGIVALSVGICQSWRFSLSTLLIATTLVAVALGLAVALR